MSEANQQRVAIVTGAGRGIGRAAAHELSRRGFRVVVASRNAGSIGSVADAVGGLAVPTDVSDPEQVDRLVRRSLEAFGRIDAVVNNAGLAPAIPLEQTSVQQWRDVLDVNLSAAFYLSRAVWPTFKQQRGGVIVNISSQAARDPFAGFGAYGAAKAGLNLLTLVLAREGAPIGVRAHAVAPGAVETEMFRGLVTEAQWPREKTLSPEDVARVVAQCVEGDLQYTSGEVTYLARTR